MKKKFLLLICLLLSVGVYAQQYELLENGRVVYRGSRSQCSAEADRRTQQEAIRQIKGQSSSRKLPNFSIRTVQGSTGGTSIRNGSGNTQRRTANPTNAGAPRTRVTYPTRGYSGSSSSSSSSTYSSGTTAGDVAEAFMGLASALAENRRQQEAAEAQAWAEAQERARIEAEERAEARRLYNRTTTAEAYDDVSSSLMEVELAEALPAGNTPTETATIPLAMRTITPTHKGVVRAQLIPDGLHAIPERSSDDALAPDGTTIAAPRPEMLYTEQLRLRRQYIDECLQTGYRDLNGYLLKEFEWITGERTAPLFALEQASDSNKPTYAQFDLIDRYNTFCEQSAKRMIITLQNAKQCATGEERERTARLLEHVTEAADQLRYIEITP